MTRLTRIALTLVLALAITALSVPAPVKGYTFIGGGSTNPKPWYLTNITWCIVDNGGWTTWHLQNTVNAAFEHWDSYMTRRTLTNQCPNATIEVRVVDFSARGWAHDAGKTIAGVGPSSMAYADIYINKDFDFWFSTAHHWCNVRCATDPTDLWTTVLHEIGHSIGLGENAGSGRNVLCTTGYDSEQTAAACVQDYYSVDVMYWAAADGYRRWIESDSINGLIALGYR